MHRYPDYFVGAFERTGKKSWILFKTPALAQQFLKDNRSKFSDLSIETKDGEFRKVFFNGYETPAHKSLLALAKAATTAVADHDEMLVHDVTTRKKTRQITINDFAVVGFSVDKAGKYKAYYDKRNIIDTKIQGLEDILKEVVDPIAADWK